jgi:hypothetical protein
MSESTNDRQVKISVSLPGQYIELTRERSWGDNPAFYAWQVEEILDAVKGPLREMITAEHGQQSAADPINALPRRRKESA